VSRTSPRRSLKFIWAQLDADIKDARVAGLVLAILIVSTKMRAGRLYGWQMAVTLFALALWLVGPVFGFLHF
jgi:hypothetical protein